MKQLNEKFEQLKRNISKLYLKILKKGREHITIMCIPHSEKEIKTIHLSYFNILFALILIISLIIFSIISVSSYITSKQKILNVTETQAKWNKTYREIKKNIQEISDIIEEIKPEIDKLYKLAVVNKEAEKIGIGGFSEKEVKRREINEEILSLYEIKKELKVSYKYLSKLREFLKSQKEVFSKIPSIWPLKVGGYITSDYGWRRNPLRRRRMEWHKGIDIGTWPGAPVVATADGIVEFAGWHGGYGLCVIIRHEYGYKTIYAHLSRIRVRTGRKVKKGDIIGNVGRTGYTTGYHLHYEIRVGNKDVNPWPYIVNYR